MTSATRKVMARNMPKRPAVPAKRSTVSNPVALWVKYNPTYLEIERNPHLQHKMRKDPGYRWMRRGWIIAWIIVLLLACAGRAANLGLW